MPTNALIGVMIEFFRKPRWIEHSLKVYAYAQGIGGEEGLPQDDMRVLAAAALLHDIGIPSAKERYGSSAGQYQEAEGASLTSGLLRRAGLPEGDWERVGWLVGHHHREALAEGDRVLQILMEADYLVNLVEGNLHGKEPREVLNGFFRTETGKRYLRALYNLDAGTEK